MTEDFCTASVLGTRMSKTTTVLRAGLLELQSAKYTDFISRAARLALKVRLIPLFFNPDVNWLGTDQHSQTDSDCNRSHNRPV